MIFRFLIFFLVSCLGPLTILAQQSIPFKNEVQTKVAKSNFPTRALLAIEEVKKVNELKLYSQVSRGEHLFEANFIKKDCDFSVTFDALGALKELEVVISLNSISPSEVQGAIRDYLASEFKQSAVIRVGQQFVPQEHNGKKNLVEDLIDDFFDGNIGKKHMVNYVLEISGKRTEDTTKLFELIFDSRGHLKSMRRIAQT